MSGEILPFIIPQIAYDNLSYEKLFAHREFMHLSYVFEGV